MRKLARWAGIGVGGFVAAAWAVACYSPNLGSPGFYCHPQDVPACPDSQVCVNGRCVNGAPDGGAVKTDLAAPPPQDLGGGTDGSSGGMTCDGPTTCLTATSLGNVNADTGGMLSGMGQTAEWLSVQAIENNNGLTGQRMRLKVTLTSPASTNFDLFVYRNGGGTQPECMAVSGSSTTTSTDVVSIDWGETDGALPNGVSDNALVTIEVRAAAGATCVAGQTWSLDVVGGP
jgi:hypothetical protein